MFERVLQARIFNCYLKNINSLDTSTPDLNRSLKNINSTFPETNGILILNWPDEDFNLRNQISLSSLEPSVQIYPSLNRELSSQPKTICIFVNKNS